MAFPLLLPLRKSADNGIRLPLPDKGYPITLQLVRTKPKPLPHFMLQYKLTHIAKQFYTIASTASRRQFIWLCFLNIIIGLFEICVAGGISLLGVAMSSPEALTRLPLLPAIAASIPFPDQVPNALRMLAVVMACIVAATAAKNALLAYLTWLQNYFAQSMAWAMGEKLFQSFLTAPYLWHTRQNSAELLTTLNWKAHISIFSVALLTLLTQTIIAIFLFSSVLFANPVMSAFLFCTIAFFAIAIHKYAQKQLYGLSTAIREYDIQNAKICMEGLHGIREIIIYDKLAAFMSAYSQFIDSYRRIASKQSLFPGLPQWCLESVGMALLLVVLLFLIALGNSVAETTGLITLLAAVSWRLLPAANKALGAIMNMRTSQPIVERFLTLLDTPQSIPAISERELLPFGNNILLQDVTFSYPNASKPALDHITFLIPKGKMIGLIGPSGSGKSTLSSIINGLVVPESGQLLVDDKPWNPQNSRLKIGYVPQNLYLLDASLAENIAFSRWGEPIDEARVLKCCTMAAIDFLEDLPTGIHTIIGERGVRLSGGQVQRVGIARALYDNPDILFFDEATSALDEGAEREIQATVTALKSSITLLVIAHRLHTVAECDIVYWVEKGRILRQGSPAEVLPEYEAALAQTPDQTV